MNSALPYFGFAGLCLFGLGIMVGRWWGRDLKNTERTKFEEYLHQRAEDRRAAERVDETTTTAQWWAEQGEPEQVQRVPKPPERIDVTHYIVPPPAWLAESTRQRWTWRDDPPRAITTAPYESGGPVSHHREDGAVGTVSQRARWDLPTGEWRELEEPVLLPGEVPHADETEWLPPPVLADVVELERV